jgi:hypothetical protein
MLAHEDGSVPAVRRNCSCWRQFPKGHQKISHSHMQCVSIRMYLTAQANQAYKADFLVDLLRHIISFGSPLCSVRLVLTLCICWAIMLPAFQSPCGNHLRYAGPEVMMARLRRLVEKDWMTCPTPPSHSAVTNYNGVNGECNLLPKPSIIDVSFC